MAAHSHVLLMELVPGLSRFFSLPIQLLSNSTCCLKEEFDWREMMKLKVDSKELEWPTGFELMPTAE